MIKPTVGRVVNFWPQTPPKPGFEYHDIRQPCTGLIAYVHGDRMVNLTVFDQAGKQFNETSVTLLQGDDRKPEGGRFAVWMPYQVGQAAKTEQLQHELASKPSS